MVGWHYIYSAARQETSKNYKQNLEEWPKASGCITPTSPFLLPFWALKLAKHESKLYRIFDGYINPCYSWVMHLPSYYTTTQYSFSSQIFNFELWCKLRMRHHLIWALSASTLPRFCTVLKMIEPKREHFFQTFPVHCPSLIFTSFLDTQWREAS